MTTYNRVARVEDYLDRLRCRVGLLWHAYQRAHDRYVRKCERSDFDGDVFFEDAVVKAAWSAYANALREHKRAWRREKQLAEARRQVGAA